MDNDVQDANVRVRPVRAQVVAAAVGISGGDTRPIEAGDTVEVELTAQVVAVNGETLVLSPVGTATVT